jgi:hypothetical protein
MGAQLLNCPPAHLSVAGVVCSSSFINRPPVDSSKSDEMKASSCNYKKANVTSSSSENVSFLDIKTNLLCRNVKEGVWRVCQKYSRN